MSVVVSGRGSFVSAFEVFQGVQDVEAVTRERDSCSPRTCTNGVFSTENFEGTLTTSDSEVKLSASRRLKHSSTARCPFERPVGFSLDDSPERCVLVELLDDELPLPTVRALEVIEGRDPPLGPPLGSRGGGGGGECFLPSCTPRLKTMAFSSCV